MVAVSPPLASAQTSTINRPDVGSPPRLAKAWPLIVKIVQDYNEKFREEAR
jgi:hypothetical protein